MNLNDKNLIPFNERTEEEQREIARQGGIASGKSRREKKTVQKILTDLLDEKIENSPQFLKLAQRMGIESNKSVKDVFTTICLLNSIKDGSLSDLEKLARLLGEEKASESNNGILEELTEWLKNE